MRFYAWAVLSSMLRRLPARWGYVIADVAGTIAFVWSGRVRRNTIANFGVVLPHLSAKERRRVARRSVRNYYRYMADFMRAEMTAPDALNLTHDESGAYAALDDALAGGRGAIVVCMHFGNWDLGAGGTAARGYDGAAVGERFGDRQLDAAVFGARERLGIRIFPLGETMLPAVRHLRGNGVLALLLDRPTPGEGVEVEFFGRKTWMPAGPARLAMRTGCAIGVAAFPRREGGYPDVDVYAEFESAPAGNDNDSEQALTQALVSRHERFVRRYPDQWYMFRRMWPEEEA